jgi:hypothetical protein
MRRRALRLAVAGCAATACSTLLWESGLPWAQAEFRVSSVDRRGPFLDVRVAADIERRFFTRATDACAAMLRPGASVTLKHTDFYGPFAQGDTECPVAGIGDLEDFRGSRSRAGYGRGPIRSSSIRIEIVHEDEEYLYARGGFSIAGMFGWSPGTDQVVALLPKIPECAPLAQAGQVSAVYRQAGRPALGISTGDALCPVSGLVGVLPEDFAGDPRTPTR